MFQVLLVSQDEAVDIIMEKQNKTDKSIVSIHGLWSILTMKQKCSTYEHFYAKKKKKNEDIGSTKECK